MQAIAFPGFIASFCVITREANHKQCLSVAPALGYLEKNETVASAQKLKFDFILPTAKTSLSTPLGTEIEVQAKVREISTFVRQKLKPLTHICWPKK